MIRSSFPLVAPLVTFLLMLFIFPATAWDPPAHLVKSTGMTDSTLFPVSQNPAEFASHWSPGEAGNAFRIRVTEQGVYRIPFNTLLAAGIAPAQMVGRELAMFHRDQPVAVYASTEGTFGSGDALYFYGEGLDSIHSSENVYWLVPGSTALRMQDRSARVLDGVGTATELPYGAIHNPRSALAPATRYWDDHWDHWYIRAMLVNVDEPFTIATPGPLGASSSTPVEIGMRAVDRNSTPTFSALRSAQVRQGGSSIGSIQYRGNGNEWQDAELPSGTVSAGNTTIDLRGTQSSIGVRDIVLTYPRVLQGINNRLCFDGKAGASNYRITNLPVNTWVLRVTDSQRPVRLVGSVASGGGVEFGDITARKPTFYLQNASTVQDITRLEPAGKPAFTDAASQRIDMVVIADTARFPAVNTLVNRRRAEGLKVLVAQPQQVYDAYGYGLRHPDAIRQFLGSLYHHGRGAPPRYVLLVGDAYIDVQNTFGFGHEDVLPTHMGGGSFNYTAHDQWFVSVNGDDDLADMGIGRFAVTSNADCAHMVNKIVAFENAALSASWRNQVHLCTDKTDNAGDFEARQEELRADWYQPNSIAATTAYYDQVSSNQWKTATAAAFASGRSLVQYMGHGFVDHWSNVFYPNDIAALNNTIAYPVVTAFACSAGEFNSPNVSGESMSENLTEQANGAVAGFAATSLAIELASAQIAHGLSEAWFEQRRIRLGDCVLGGLEELHRFNGSSPELQFYALTGDPSLRLNRSLNSGDSDGDGMPNAYEVQHGLEPYVDDAAEDADGDSLSNLQEYLGGTLPRDSDSDQDQLFDSWEAVIGTDPNDTDSDNDGMPDAWEWEYALQPAANDAQQDADSDGLINRDEYLAGTDPNLADSDFDGLNDGAEATAGSNPLLPDTDGDGVSDGEEVNNLGTDPADRDTNNDGLPDGFPTPGSADFDNDGLSNAAEAAAGTDPRDADTDNDGLADGAEITTDPTNPDSDNDGVGDAAEVLYGLQSNNRDTDNDGLFDGWETFYGLDHLVADAAIDTDGDGLLNIEEFVSGSNPRDKDSDDDGLEDGPEVHTYETLPTVVDTDGDGLGDGDEVNTYGSNPTELDSDGDSLEDGDEVNIHGSSPALSDTDGDTMPDDWEVQFGLDPAVNDGNADADVDGLSNKDEFAEGTKPNVGDTDFDTLKDGDEVNIHGTDPTRRDTDSDQAYDAAEIAAGSDPHVRDTDGDGMQDGFEIQYGLNPLVADATGDPDGDGLSNLDEAGKRTDPFAVDTDGDGISDVQEIADGTIPYRADHDFDGLDDGDEVNVYNTNPRDRDSDDDGLRDGQEVNTYGTNPLLRDTDGDGIEDRDETRQGSNPLVADATADPDGDGLNNLAESVAGTRANNVDSDGDTISDGDEVNVHSSDPTDRDSDDDGLNDDVEINTHGTSPILEDTDGDRMDDAWEIANGLNPLMDDSLLDPEGDGLPNLQEYLFATDPQKLDTDNDGLNDLVEILAGTAANAFDTDADGMSDDYELRHGLDPNRNDAAEDPDGDQMTSLAEHDAGTHPKIAGSVFEIRIQPLAPVGSDMLRVTWGSVAGQSYRLMATTDLESAPFALVQAGIAATPPLNTVDINEAVFEAFRVEIE